MNYNSVILVGVLFLTTFWWFVRARTKYPGPKMARLYHGGMADDDGEKREQEKAL